MSPTTHDQIRRGLIVAVDSSTSADAIPKLGVLVRSSSIPISQPVPLGHNQSAQGDIIPTVRVALRSNADEQEIRQRNKKQRCETCV
ncbi:hypothetical protein VTJ04DRAFT_6423 [Mycothermus thermophilus]|uniref:uncharacterized protein n=1 Tax=Humicola insolens TaxID=85995 RepID=UPI0037423B26